MHELSITEGILNTALKEAQKNNADRIVSIHLCVGAMSGIVCECVQEYFDLLSEDTIAQNAKLSFTIIPTRLRCRDCGEEFNIRAFRMICPKCQSLRTDILAGKELYIENMEIETDSTE